MQLAATSPCTQAWATPSVPTGAGNGLGHEASTANTGVVDGAASLSGPQLATAKNRRGEQATTYVGIRSRFHGFPPQGGTFAGAASVPSVLSSECAALTPLRDRSPKRQKELIWTVFFGVGAGQGKRLKFLI